MSEPLTRDSNLCYILLCDKVRVDNSAFTNEHYCIIGHIWCQEFFERSKADKMNGTDKIFYGMGLVILGALITVAVLQTTGVLVLTDIGMPCTFRSITGLYCPGCGGTHAVCALARGNLIESFLLHPFVPYTALCFLIFILWNTIATIEGGRKFRFFHFHTAYVYIGIAILLIQWIIKNILLTID